MLSQSNISDDFTHSETRKVNLKLSDYMFFKRNIVGIFLLALSL